MCSAPIGFTTWPAGQLAAQTSDNKIIFEVIRNIYSRWCGCDAIWHDEAVLKLLVHDLVLLEFYWLLKYSILFKLAFYSKFQFALGIYV